MILIVFAATVILAALRRRWPRDLIFLGGALSTAFLGLLPAPAIMEGLLNPALWALSALYIIASAIEKARLSIQDIKPTPVAFICIAGFAAISFGVPPALAALGTALLLVLVGVVPWKEVRTIIPRETIILMFSAILWMTALANSPWSEAIAIACGAISSGFSLIIGLAFPPPPSSLLFPPLF